tara:strand:- start:86 stop:835 length:750 start_codon:yes stop_codon:yes gene_type:complete
MFDAMCKVESGCPNNCDTNPVKNTCDAAGCIDDNGNLDCVRCGCVPGPNGWTERQKDKCWSCGPYQIKRKYWEEAQWACRPGHPANETACCELLNHDWEQTLCNGNISCAEQKRLSELAMKCYFRRYTRNGGCQCQGSCIKPNCGPNSSCPDRCFSCEDLARMHNGGPCGHTGTGTDGYIEKMCTFLESMGSACCDCIGSCDCEDEPPVLEEEKRRSRRYTRRDTRGKPYNKVETNRQNYWEKQSKKKL